MTIPALAKRPKKKKTPFQKRLLALQKRLGLDRQNKAMAAHMGIPLRLLHAWKYGEHTPGGAGEALIALIEKIAKSS